LDFQPKQYSYDTVTEIPLLNLVADEAAPRLLGWRLVSKVDGQHAEIALTEVEAYRSDDPASHSYGGPRGRNVIMFERPGLLYVYRSYGIHWCANVVCGGIGVGSAVLFRSGRPVTGEETMERRRGRATSLTTGPGNLCKALGIDGSHNGLDLLDPTSPIRLLPGPPPANIEITRRIGITKAVETPWRFVAINGGPHA
jgi:DNA-3-methyladenine glycosylase